MKIPGPKPKSGKQKILEGNPGQRQISGSEPEPASGEPEMPSHFDDEDKEVWRWLCGELESLGLLVRSDAAMMMLYCHTAVNYVEAVKAVKEKGLYCTGVNGGEYMAPWFNAMCAMGKQLSSYAAELGLTAVARTRIKTNKKQISGKEEKYFKQGQKSQI